MEIYVTGTRGHWTIVANRDLGDASFGWEFGPFKDQAIARAIAARAAEKYGLSASACERIRGGPTGRDEARANRSDETGPDGPLCIG